MYAIIETGGKQFKVQEGDVIYVEKLDKVADEEFTFDKVLLIADGDAVRVGKPLVEGALVEAKLVKQVKGQKIVVFKYKAKKNYRRKTGHRQPYSKVEILGIHVG